MGVRTGNEVIRDSNNKIRVGKPEFRDRNSGIRAGTLEIRDRNLKFHAGNQTIRAGTPVVRNLVSRSKHSRSTTGV
ncbi:hypothetical protein AV656_11870 [Bhargavaea cecembensis]|uniref:Uncharacterized protein n=1 Tax=Bhargavaea cecembensis TaxID=394098 RepID=A0A165GQ79_9BACL|nr:hypothetical protein [Bhargavaea cecembensis]KZE37259.1 hypothetical protein AV656_11870 [Bhargavaea cecembensis]